MQILAVANQKGGVGKTTSTVNLAAYFAHDGLRTLLIDLDPQGSASSGLSIKLLTDGIDLYDIFLGSNTIKSLIKPTDIINLSVVPASKDLVSLELDLGSKPGRELVLKSALNSLKGEYDIVLIDCPPSSGLLTLNALGAAKWVIVPLQAEYYALEGITSLMETLKFVQATYNSSLDILGVFLTMSDSRTRLSSQVEDEARSFFSNKMFETKIPRNIKLSECPSHGIPISLYDATSAGAKAYNILSKEIQERLNIKEVVPRGTYLRVANEEV
jgi:chromosome partitioning protein